MFQSEKVPIPSTQRSLIVMCQVLGYKPLITQVVIYFNYLNIYII